MNINKMNPRIISHECSPVHNMNVIKDLQEKVKEALLLADEVLTLNHRSGEIGEGKVMRLIELAEQFKYGIEV